MNASSVVSWLAEVSWGYNLAGRWTALLILAWVVHAALAGRNPRWRVLLWRSAAVGLATVKVRLNVRVGDLAPDFTAPRLDGGQFKLSEQRGKLVLLDFWATWCQPCLAEMPAIKDIQQTFGADARFVLVGVSCDEAAQAPATYTKANGLSWTQVFGGPVPQSVRAAPAKDFQNVGETYLIRGIPATFLIGPNGRILARDLRGPALKEAVGKALSDEELFSGVK
jgi:peroxiredoxin